MRPRRLLYLSAQQMTAWHWRRGMLAREATFPPTEAGFRQFAHYLAQNPKSTFSLLVNVADEAFRIETIPYLRGADRRVVIRRRLAQTFFNTSFSAAISLGREKNRRKDERLLLANLANSAFFRPWLDGIQATDTTLSGIFSLPLIAPEIFRILRLPPEPCLLLTIQDQSIRQSFLDRGELNFSRLTPLPHDGVADLARAFSTESARLQQYLSSQRLIERGQTIPAYVLAHPGAFRAIREHCADTPAIRFHLVDLTECARRAGLASVPQDTCGETLFLHLMATRPPAAQFAGEDLRHRFRVARIRSAIRYAGLAVLAASLALAGKYGYDAHRIAQDAAALQAEAAQARQRYGEIIETFPQLPIDNETLKRVIEGYLAEERRGTTPIAFYREISRALEAEPAVELDRLDWRAGGFVAEDGDPASLLENSESVVVRGTLRLGTHASVRQVLAAFDRFVDGLRACGLRVEILRQPLDIASGSSLNSGDAAQEGEQPRDFGLRVIRRIAP
jgi:hypothetical protein